jgi:hypothetical protein
MTACGGLIVHSVTLFARLQVQRRGAVIAELRISWIAMAAKGTHPVAKIRSALGERPVRRAWRAHAGILSRCADLDSPADKRAPAWRRPRKVVAYFG